MYPQLNGCTPDRLFCHKGEKPAKPVKEKKMRRAGEDEEKVVEEEQAPRRD
jgi:hypothetical protein